MTNIMQLLNMMGKKVMPIDINIYIIKEEYKIKIII